VAHAPHPSAFRLAVSGVVIGGACPDTPGFHRWPRARQGQRDCQVYATREFGRWRHTFANDTHVRLIDYPGLSHLFMPAGQPPQPADYAKPGHVDGTVIDDIGAWIHSLPLPT